MKSYNTTKELLLSTTIPQETRTYKPITHQQLIDITMESIEQSGFVLDKELYTCCDNGMVATGRYTIKNVADTEMQLEFGWQNSYNKKVSLKVALGTRIMICQNGCVSGDYGAFRKKHMGEVQSFTPAAITEYIKQAGEAFTRIQGERDQMKNIQVSKRQAAEIVGRMFIEEQIIESTQINIISRELQAPTYNYNADPESLWALYQHTTYAMKEVHPTMWMKKHIDVHSFFVNEAGILVNTLNKEITIEEESPFVQLQLFENELG
jgi:hypothetical protein